MRGRAQAARDLRALSRDVASFGPGLAERKLARLKALDAARLGSARAVQSLHEALCFLRAYPDSRQVHSQVVRMLKRFERRPDLNDHAEALESSGIAGTATRYSFFHPTATWMARQWPRSLHLDWEQVEDEHLVGAYLTLLGLPCEDLALDEADNSLREMIDELRGPRTTDGTWIVERLDRIQAQAVVRQVVYDSLELPLILKPGPRTPNRTRVQWPLRKIHLQTVPLDRTRPELRQAVMESPRAVVSVSPREGARWIELAREAMVARSRDLEVFMHGDPRDVRRIAYGDGLEFVMIGMRPERRLLLEAVYGFLTVKNGVPIGYVLASALFGSAGVAYNVFETWRGGESALVYGKILAMVRHMLGVDTFSVDPYQLGHDNDEGLDSGAWWFYYKLGFRPRDAGVQRLLKGELARMRRRPSHRSSRDTLQALSAAHVFLSLGEARDDVIGDLPLGAIGLGVLRYVARRFGADREAGEAACVRDATALLHAGRLSGWSKAQRAAFRAWAPLIAALPGISRWSPAQRRALLAVVRAKGDRRESEFVKRFDSHPLLRRALLALARRGVTRS